MPGRAFYPAALLLLATLSACQATAPAGLQEVTLSVKADLSDARRGVLTLRTPVLWDHIDIALLLGGVPVTSIPKRVTAATLTSPVIFQHLRPNQTYTATATAYSDSAGLSKLSIDAGSSTTLSTVALDDNQTVSVPVQMPLGDLFDGTLSDGAASSGVLVVTPGTLSNPLAPSLTIAGTQTQLVAGSGTPGSGPLFGVGNSVSLNTPEGLAVLNTASPYNGHVFLADSLNHRIERFDASNAMTVFAGSATAVAGTANGVGMAASFNTPTDVVFTPDFSKLYVADTGNNVIRQIVIATGNVTTVAGLASVSGSIDGSGSSARFIKPSHLALDATGQFLYVADTEPLSSFSCIRRIDTLAGFATTTLLTNVTAGYADGQADTFSAQLNGPQGLAVVGSHLYIADSNNSAIRDLDLNSHAVTTLAGILPVSGAPTPGFTDGIGNSTLFDHPWGLTVLGGKLIVADANNNRLRQIDLSTKQVTTLAGGGSTGYGEGALLISRIESPHGLAAKGSTLYFTTSDHHLRKIQ